MSKSYMKHTHIVGKLFFALSIVMLVYMVVSSLNGLIFQIDEFFTIGILNFPVMDIITITGYDVHPPLYYMICKAVLKILNLLGLNYNLIQVLRFVSIFPYFMVLAVSYVKFRDEYGWLMAGLFPFALAVMSEFFTYFLNIRMYSWGLLFLLLSFICFKNLLVNFDKKSWFLLTLFSVLGAYTHYFVAFQHYSFIFHYYCI